LIGASVCLTQAAPTTSSPPVGNAFPILLYGAEVPVAAASRAGAGRAVAFTREAFVDLAGDNAKMATTIGRFLVNVARWASGTTAGTVRVAGPTSEFACAQCITNLNTVAVSGTWGSLLHTLLNAHTGIVGQPRQAVGQH
jgi:hypothetical protein